MTVRGVQKQARRKIKGRKRLKSFDARLLAEATKNGNEALERLIQDEIAMKFLASLIFSRK